MGRRRGSWDLRTLSKLKKAEPGKRYDHPDPATPGLVLRVTDTGAKTFAWVRRVGARVERVRIGPLEDFESVDDVRTVASRYNAALAEGRNPAEERRAARSGMTFGELWKLYLAAAKAKKRSWPTDVKRHKHLEAWSSRPLDALTRRDAAELLAKISASAPIQANRVRALGHRMWRWAQREKGLDVANPFEGTSRNPENRKERRLEPGELRRFWRALNEEPDSDVRDFLALLLLTAVRGGTLAAARWADLDLDDRVWHVPADTMKAGKPLDLPLARRAAELLEERKRLVPKDAVFVFPSKRNESGHLVETPREGFRRVLNRAELAGLTPHDLRRTHASYGLQAGAPIEVLGRALGHTPIGGVTSIYARADLRLVRLAVDLAVKTLLTIAESEDKEGAEVIQFPTPAWAAS